MWVCTVYYLSASFVGITCGTTYKFELCVFPAKLFSIHIFDVGKHTLCKLSFVYTSQAILTVRIEQKFG